MRKTHTILAGLMAITVFASVGCQVDTPEFLVTAPLLRQRGFDAINAGNWPLAREEFAKAVAKSPDDAISQYYLGLAELKVGNPMAAQLALEKALSVAPNDPDLTPRILDRLAQAYYLQDRRDVLIGFLEQTSQASHHTRDYLRQANYLVKLGDVDSAELAYRKAAYFAPHGDNTPYIAIADFYMSLGDKENAVLALKYAYYVSPEDPQVASRMRSMGLVPGPTYREEPPKPAMLNKPWKSPMSLDVIVDEVDQRVR